MNGPIIYDLSALFGLSPGFGSPVSGTLNFRPADVADLNAGNLYVNIHTSSFPGGELRGQIGMSSVHVVQLIGGAAVSGRDFGNRDSIPPTLTNFPGNQTIEATSAAGAVATYPSPTATDAVDSTPSVTCSPASGSVFPLGSTTVTCMASDDAGNSSSTGFQITVQDTTAPSLTLSPNLTREATVCREASKGFRYRDRVA